MARKPVSAPALKAPVKRGKRPTGMPNGRPKALHPDERALRIVKGLGKIQATNRECASVLGVSLPTFKLFLLIPEVAEALEIGKGQGCVSLRRHQFALAQKNAAMAIFLGKNFLEQTDKVVNEHAGTIEMKGSGVSALLAAAKRGANASEPD